MPRPKNPVPLSAPPSSRSLAATIFAAAVLGSAIVLRGAPHLAAPPAAAQSQGEPSTADLLVDFGDGRVAFERIAIEDGASGFDLLSSAELDVEFGAGGLVCRIEGVGCPAADCFCACRELDDCTYWSYFHDDPAVDGGWQFASVGAEGRRLAAGAVDAWVWGQKRGPITTTLALRDALADGRITDDVDAVEAGDAVAAEAGDAADASDAADADRAAVETATAAAAAWIAGRRTDDGGFEGFGLGSTIDAVLALAAVGEDPDRPDEAGARPSDALTAGAAEYSAGGASAAGKLMAGAAALGLDARDLGGADVVGVLMDGFDPASGAFGAGGTWDQAWAIIGLAAHGIDVPEPAVERLVEIAVDGDGDGEGTEPGEREDETDREGDGDGGDVESGGSDAGESEGEGERDGGGWGFEADAPMADADSTGLALQALGAAGLAPSDAAIRGGLMALRALQTPDGGFAGHDGLSNATSTAYAIGGLVAAGQAADGLGWSVVVPDAPDQPRSPFDALLSFQGDDGAFAGFSGPADPSATYAALLGLSGRALPVGSGDVDAGVAAPDGSANQLGDDGMDDGAPTGDAGGEGSAAEPAGDREADAPGADPPGGDGDTRSDDTTGAESLAARLGAWPFAALVVMLALAVWWMRRRT